MHLITERLLLRPLSLADLKTVHDYANDNETTFYMLLLFKETEAETEAFLRKVDTEWQKPHPLFYEFAVVLHGLQIGAVSLYCDDTQTQGEIGWVLNKKYWHNGYATEAAKAVIGFAKDKLKLQKLTAHCDERNTPSKKVMEKLGMKLIDDSGCRRYARRDETAKECTYALKLNG